MHSLSTLFAVLCSCPPLWCAVCLQEIVANLVMHLGSGNVDESDASLDVLAGLVEQHLAAMAPFAIFFKVCQTGFTCLWALSHSWLVEFQMCTDSVFKQQHQRFYSLNTPLLKFCVSFSLALFCGISFFFHLFVFVCYQVLWPLIQGHNCVRNMNWKYCCLDSCLVSSKCCIVATCIKLIMHNMLYSLCGLISV